MSHRRRSRPTGAAVMLAVLTACSGSGSAPDPAPTPTPDPMTSPTITASEPVTSESNHAAETATSVLRAFYELRDKLRQEPATPLDALDEVTISTELSAQKALFAQEREDGLRQSGSTRITELIVYTVNLDHDDPQSGRVPIVQLDVCYDVSDVDIVDEAGQSMITPNRADTGWIRYTVANYEWDTDPSDAWRVASSENIERQPCAVS